jgi:hypothetical protein
MRLVIGLATRGRPAELLETLAITLPNIQRRDTVIMVAADADDHATIDTVEKSFVAGGQVILSVEPREDSVGAKWNRALAIPGDVYLIMADTIPYITWGFDQKIVEAASLFPDGIGYVVGPLVNGSFSGTMAVTRKFAELFDEQILPTYFPYWFADHWLDDVARITGRIAYVDGVIRNERTHITQELREPGWWADWFDAAYLLRRASGHKIVKAMQEPHWRKRILYTHHPLIERRSCYINDIIRARSREWTALHGFDMNDTRYQRIRQKAAAMVPLLLADMPQDEASYYRERLLPPDTVLNLRRA